MNNSRLEQLRQLKTITWDGGVISKSDRDELIKLGWVNQIHGWNYLTTEGVNILIAFGELKP